MGKVRREKGPTVTDIAVRRAHPPQRTELLPLNLWGCSYCEDWPVPPQRQGAALHKA